MAAERFARWVTGKINGALSFDGIDDYVDVGAGSSLDNLGSLTYAVWVKPDSVIKSNGFQSCSG